MNPTDPTATASPETLPTFTLKKVLSPTVKKNLTEKGFLEGTVVSSHPIRATKNYRVTVKCSVNKGGKPVIRNVTFVHSESMEADTKVRLQLAAA